MAVPKANQRAVNKYKKNNYDRIEITVPKGQRAVFQAHAEAHGESVNGFITRSIREALDRDTGTVDGAQDTALTPVALETIQAAISATGETIPQFVGRAVNNQAERDRRSLAMGINPATGDKTDGGDKDVGKGTVESD